MRGSILRNSLFQNIEKEFRVEFRNRYALNVSLSFAIIATLSISLSLGGISVSGKIQSVLLWIILFFSAMNGLSHIFIREEEEGTSLFLRVNAKPIIVLSSKLIFNVILFLLLQVIIIPLFIFFMGMPVFGSMTAFILTALSGGLALSTSGTIFSAIAAKAGGRGPLFTIISFPIVLPVIWIASESTAATLSKTGSAAINNIIFLFAFSGAITALSYILFDYIWIEE